MCDVHVSGWLVVVPFALALHGRRRFCDDPRARRPTGDLIKFFNTPYIESIGRNVAKLFKLGVDIQMKNRINLLSERRRIASFIRQD